MEDKVFLFFFNALNARSTSMSSPTQPTPCTFNAKHFFSSNATTKEVDERFDVPSDTTRTPLPTTPQSPQVRTSTGHKQHKTKQKTVTLMAKTRGTTSHSCWEWGPNWKSVQPTHDLPFSWGSCLLNRSTSKRRQSHTGPPLLHVHAIWPVFFPL